MFLTKYVFLHIGKFFFLKLNLLIENLFYYFKIAKMCHEKDAHHNEFSMFHKIHFVENSTENTKMVALASCSHKVVAIISGGPFYTNTYSPENIFNIKI